MSNIELFIEHLKQDKVIEAYAIIKEELSQRSRKITESINISVAESFNMKHIVEEKEDDDEEENLSEEEKEAKKAKEASDKE